MPPRKKLKRDTSEEKGKGASRKSSESTTQLVAENKSGGENLYFSLLPNEVLLSIYKYLRPVDLLAIAELGDSRLAQLIYLTKEYNFSSCHKDNVNAKFFFQRQVARIRKLNFNNEMYLKSHELVQFICKCKNLTHLSIVNCGIKNYHHLCDILLYCTKLKELAVDIPEDCFLNMFQDGRDPTLEKVYFFGDFTKQKSFSTSNLASVSFAQSIFLNFTVDSFLALPFLGNWSRAYCISFVNNTNHVYIYNSFHCCMEEFNSKIEAHRIAEKSTLFHPSVYNAPPFLQIRTLESDISLIKSASNTISSVNLILQPKIVDLWPSLVQALTRVGEHSLKHLSIDSTGTSEYDDGTISGPISPEESLAVCDMFDKIFMTFKNLTVLNIATVHFSSCSPFITAYRLESIKTLSISSCAFKSFKLSGFDKVVLRCPKVRSFSLYCCQDDQNKLSEQDLIPMRAWKDLTHLTLYSVIFRNCSFLKKVADSCKKFTSLSIITVHPNSVCLFMTDLIYVLKVAKNLSFIRINVKNFNPMYEGFWNAIGEAKNLEGICLTTESNTYVATQVILKGIKKLKHLHVFHLYAPKTSEGLYLRVKNSMKAQGVNNCKIEKDCVVTHRECKRPYYHQQPRFCCNRIHLTDMNII